MNDGQAERISQTLLVSQSPRLHIQQKPYHVLTLNRSLGFLEVPLNDMIVGPIPISWNSKWNDLLKSDGKKLMKHAARSTLMGLSWAGIHRLRKKPVRSFGNLLESRPESLLGRCCTRACAARLGN